MLESKFAQQALGLFLVTVGIGFTAATWFTAVSAGYYYPKAAAAFPAMAVYGFGALFFPVDMDELRAKHDIDKPTKLAHYPLPSKVFFFLALAAGFGNLYAMSQLW
jgi:hypothetical protein